MAVLLGVAGGGVGLLALLLIRPAVLGRLGGVRAQLVGAGLIGSLLLLGMMLAGARAMFISGHDLSLLLTMLTFAAALSVGFGLLYAMPLSSRIERVRAGTERIAGGANLARRSGRGPRRGRRAGRRTSTAWRGH